MEDNQKAAHMRRPDPVEHLGLEDAIFIVLAVAACCVVGSALYSFMESFL